MSEQSEPPDCRENGDQTTDEMMKIINDLPDTLPYMHDAGAPVNFEPDSDSHDSLTVSETSDVAQEELVAADALAGLDDTQATLDNTQLDISNGDVEMTAGNFVANSRDPAAIDPNSIVFQDLDTGILTRVLDDQNAGFANFLSGPQTDVLRLPNPFPTFPYCNLSNQPGASLDGLRDNNSIDRTGALGTSAVNHVTLDQSVASIFGGSKLQRDASTEPAMPDLDFGKSLLGKKKAQGSLGNADSSIPLVQKHKAKQFVRFHIEDASDDEDEIHDDDAEDGIVEQEEQDEFGYSQEFKDLQAAYRQKRVAGTIEELDEIEYRRTKKQEDDRIRRAIKERSSINEAGHDENGEQDPSEAEGDPDDSDYDADVHESPSREKVEKRYARHVSKLEAPVTLGKGRKRKADNDAEPSETPGKKGKRNTAGPSKTTEPKKRAPRAKKDGAGPAQGKAARKSRQKKEAPAKGNIDSLFGSNVFRDFEQTKNLGHQPTFTGQSKRAAAMRELLDSIPRELRKETRDDEELLTRASLDLGKGFVTPTGEGRWTVRGMKTSLTHYQLTGVAFMRKRETGEEEPKGGILSDAMGLGKTVQMLCTIINSRRTDRTQKATLVIAAPDLCRQWMREINKHCLFKEDAAEYATRHGLKSVHFYSGPGRVNKVNFLEKQSIVLTTYNEVARSYPKADPPKEVVTTEARNEWWREHFVNNCGILHQCEWHRVVLDEAHAIKNYETRTSMACRSLDAVHRWAITGTPVMNTLKEFYPYFKFLRMEHTGDFGTFRANFCTGSDPDGAQRLKVFLGKVMLRRTHKDTMFDAKLLDLPDPSERTVQVDFGPVERHIYEVVKLRMIQTINAIAASSQSALQKYKHVFEMLLRLRQMTAHVFLVQTTIAEMLQRDDFEQLNLVLAAHDDETSKAMGEYLNVMLAAAAKGVKVTATNEDILMSQLHDQASEGPSGSTPKKSELQMCLRDLVRSTHWTRIRKETYCVLCKRMPEPALLTSCGHIYCKTCLDIMMHYSARQNKDSSICKQCGQTFEEVKELEDPKVPLLSREEQMQLACEDLVDDDDDDDDTPRSKSKKKKRKDGMNDWLAKLGHHMPSAKILAVKALVKTWLDEDSGVKIIIYSQFVPMIKLLTAVCRNEGWGVKRYLGQMSGASRDKAVEKFDSDPEIRILIASLRCGSQGLNLTMASKVILIDPWWNNAAEQQAFCRVFRIGQERETELVRIIVSDTIDGTIMDMKEMKEAEICQVLNNRQAETRTKQLLGLFGEVGERNGQPFIFAGAVEDERTVLPESQPVRCPPWHKE